MLAALASVVKHEVSNFHQKVSGPSRVAKSAKTNGLMSASKAEVSSLTSEDSQGPGKRKRTVKMEVRGDAVGCGKVSPEEKIIKRKEKNQKKAKKSRDGTAQALEALMDVVWSSGLLQPEKCPSRFSRREKLELARDGLVSSLERLKQLEQQVQRLSYENRSLSQSSASSSPDDMSQWSSDLPLEEASTSLCEDFDFRLPCQTPQLVKRSLIGTLKWPLDFGRPRLGPGLRGEVDDLIHRGADVNEQDETGHTPLHWAAGYGLEEIVALLTGCGAHPNSAAQTGWTPLHSACLQRAPSKSVHVLLERGADTSARDKHGRTALHIAASVGNLEAMGALIDAGASMATTDEDGATALHVAAKHAQLGAIKLLLERGNMTMCDPPVEDGLKARAVQNGKARGEGLQQVGDFCGTSEDQFDTCPEF